MMRTLQKYRTVIDECLNPLVYRFGFVVSSSKDELIVAQAGNVQIEIKEADPRYHDLSISLLNLDHVPPKRYIPLYLLELAAPDALAKRSSARREGPPPEAKEDVRDQVQTVVTDLIEWYPDLLRGDFSTLEAGNRYQNYVSEIENLTLGPLQTLPYDDPIKQKFWANDVSWVQDLKERLKQADRSNESPPTIP